MWRNELLSWLTGVMLFLWKSLFGQMDRWEEVTMVKDMENELKSFLFCNRKRESGRLKFRKKCRNVESLI